VLDGQGWSTAGGEEGRRPCPGTSVPGEGPVNMGKYGAHEHQ
jgi:hypothetical protein